MAIVISFSLERLKQITKMCAIILSHVLLKIAHEKCKSAQRTRSAKSNIQIAIFMRIAYSHASHVQSMQKCMFWIILNSLYDLPHLVRCVFGANSIAKYSVAKYSRINCSEQIWHFMAFGNTSLRATCSQRMVMQFYYSVGLYLNK